MKKVSLRFVRWGTALLFLGLWSGYGPFHHYMHGGAAEVSCPWAPVHAHVVLLGWVGLTIFGLVYRALPGWGTLSPAAVKLATVHLWLSVASVLGVWANGIFGYRYFDHVSPGFYYEPEMETLRTWMTIDGLFLSLFGLGCVLFAWVVFFSTKAGVKEAA